MNPQNREDIKIGQEVEVVLKEDQRTGTLMRGIVAEILTNSGFYPQAKGKFFDYFSSKNNISEELKTGGSRYFDVLKIKEDIWGKKLKHRSEKN